MREGDQWAASPLSEACTMKAIIEMYADWISNREGPAEHDMGDAKILVFNLVIRLPHADRHRKGKHQR